MREDKRTEMHMSGAGRRPKAVAAVAVFACTIACVLALAGCAGQSEAGSPPVPYGVVERPTPGGTLVPLPTTDLAAQAALSATPPSAPTAGPSAVPSPTPPGQSGAGKAAPKMAQPAQAGTPTPAPTPTATPTATPTKGG